MFFPYNELHSDYIEENIRKDLAACKKVNIDFNLFSHNPVVMMVLRAMIAEGEIHCDDLTIIHYDLYDNKVIINNIPVDETGMVTDFPTGFYDARLNLSIRINNVRLSINKIFQDSINN